MKPTLKTLLLYCLLLAGPMAALAQCNFKVLMTDGKALFGQQQYRAALKKYNAARICDPSRSADVDREVDRVFEAIERQRNEAERQRELASQEKSAAEAARRMAEEALRQKDIETQKTLDAIGLAQRMRDSADAATLNNRRAQEKIVLLIQTNDLQELAEAEMALKNYERALAHYTEALAVLENLPGADSALIRKKEVLELKRNNTATLLDSQRRFQQLILEGDSLRWLESSYFAEAYQRYLEASRSGYDGLEIVLNRMSRMENLLDEQVRPKGALNSYAYCELMGRSAEANLLLNNRSQARKRVRKALLYQPDDLSFLRHPDLIAYQQHYSWQLYRRNISLYAGVQIPVPEAAQGLRLEGADTKPGRFTYAFYTLGLWYQLSPKIQVGAGWTAPLSQSESSYVSEYSLGDTRISIYPHFKTRLTAFSLNGAVEILRLRNKKWRAPQFSLQALASWSMGTLKRPSGYTIFIHSPAQLPDSYAAPPESQPNASPYYQVSCPPYTGTILK